MTHRPQARLRDESDDRDRWAQPGATLVLVLNSVLWVLWWVASLVVCPIRLAIRRHEDEMTDEVWSSGERR